MFDRTCEKNGVNAQMKDLDVCAGSKMQLNGVIMQKCCNCTTWCYKLTGWMREDEDWLQVCNAGTCEGK